jgi:hypothetical protein
MLAGIPNPSFVDYRLTGRKAIQRNSSLVYFCRAFSEACPIQNLVRIAVYVCTLSVYAKFSLVARR